MADPIVDTALAFANTLLENPFVGPAILAGVRSITGYIQLKLKKETGKDFDKKILGATLLKYEVAINALVPVVSTLAPGMDTSYVGYAVLVADILGSFARKLKNGK